MSVFYIFIGIFIYYIISRYMTKTTEEGFTLQKLYNKHVRFIRYNAPSPISNVLTTIADKVNYIFT